MHYLLPVLFVIKLVPYIIAFVNAYQKRYHWLTALCVYLILLAIFNYARQSLDPISQLLAAIFAYLLMMTALNLKTREKK